MMKLLPAVLVGAVLASCCPFSLISDTRPGAEKAVLSAYDPILKKEAPGLSLDGSLKVDGEWAFFLGSTVNEAGEQVTPPDGISSDTVILFRKKGREWEVVEHGLGISDAYYLAWVEEYGIPKSLLMP